MSAPGPQPIPRDYQLALDTARHRLDTQLKQEMDKVSTRLTRLGFKSGDPATKAQLRYARSAMVDAQNATWRSVARLLSMNRYDAAVAAVNLHDLTPLIRTEVISKLESALPSIIDDSMLANTSATVTEGWLGNLMDRLAASNLPAREVASTMLDWVNPDVSGGLSYAADRLVQDQLSNSFHDAQVETADLRGIATVFWRLDPGHDREDECDDYADQEFYIDDVPDIPHIGCLCYLEPGQNAEEAAAGQTIDGGNQDNADNQLTFEEMNAATIKGAVEVPLLSTPDVVQGWAEKLRGDAGSNATVRVMQTPSGGYTYHVFR